MFSVDLSTRECDGHVVVALRRELDLVDAADVAAALAAAVAAGSAGRARREAVPVPQRLECGHSGLGVGRVNLWPPHTTSRMGGRAAGATCPV